MGPKYFLLKIIYLSFDLCYIMHKVFYFLLQKKNVTVIVTVGPVFSCLWYGPVGLY